MRQRLPMKWLLHLAVLLGAMPVAAQDAVERRNWINDPFFQIAAQAPRCPVPLAPHLTAAEQRAEAHYRAERGTSCWLADAHAPTPMPTTRTSLGPSRPGGTSTYPSHAAACG